MGSHIFVVVSGAGWRLILACAPYRVRIGSALSEVEVEVECVVNGWKRCTLSVDRAGYRTRLGPDVQGLAEVLDVHEGPHWDGWWLETSLYRIRLPEHWTALASGNPADASMFDLLGPGQSSIFIQVPRRLPTLDQLVAPGQRVLERGGDAGAAFLELGYTHDGEEWLQRRELRQLGNIPVVVTLQTLHADAAAARPTLAAVLESLQRTSA